jgi:hypothetical protein
MPMLSATMSAIPLVERIGSFTRHHSVTRLTGLANPLRRPCCYGRNG